MIIINDYNKTKPVYHLFIGDDTYFLSRDMKVCWIDDNDFVWIDGVETSFKYGAMSVEDYNKSLTDKDNHIVAVLSRYEGEEMFEDELSYEYNTLSNELVYIDCEPEIAKEIYSNLEVKFNYANDIVFDEVIYTRDQSSVELYVISDICDAFGIAKVIEASYRAPEKVIFVSTCDLNDTNFIKFVVEENGAVYARDVYEAIEMCNTY